MKTNLISFSKPSLNSIIGFLSILLTVSCGSYQNSSYYDTDGIYGNTSPSSRESIRVIQNESNIAYQNYFNSLQDTDENTAIFTDINSYSNYSNQTKQQSNYASWGSNAQEININYSPSNWGMYFGLGYPYYGYNSWRNPYYNWYSPYGYWNNPYYNWGYFDYYGYGYYPYYGWGYPTYGYNYNYSYSHHTPTYSYNPSRRGSEYAPNSSSIYNIGRTSTNSTTENPTRTYYNRTTTAPTLNRNSSSVQSQNFLYNNSMRARTSSSSDSNYNPSRSYNTNRSNDNYTPARTYSPNRSNESYSPSQSNSSYDRPSGGGSYGGGGGSYSGGRRGGGR